MAYLQSPINLKWTSLDRGNKRRPRRTCKIQTERPQLGFEPGVFLLWDNCNNHALLCAHFCIKLPSLRHPGTSVWPLYAHHIRSLCFTLPVFGDLTLLRAEDPCLCRSLGKCVEITKLKIPLNSVTTFGLNSFSFRFLLNPQFLLIWPTLVAQKSPEWITKPSIQVNVK